MIKDIITDEAVLSTPCEPATAEDAAVAQDLVDTLLANEDAAALAANQIGVTKAIVAYLNDKNRPVVLYNPQLTQTLKPFPAVEACLSREDAAAVTRYKWIRVSYDALLNGELMPRKKKLEGWEAQLVQHMIDHCNGVLV
ncbi:MAG: formylmethionine deformylase [Eggerthellaceae bacterium]|nr:formylmethionine deformylase [Eggerthellaceae bacterium]